MKSTLKALETPGRPFIHDVNAIPQPPEREVVERRTVLFLKAIAMEQVGGGAGRDRTDDLMLAKHALYQLSYGPDGELAGRPGVTTKCGGPRQTRTADLTLIRRVL